MESPVSAPLLYQRSYPQTRTYRSLLHLCSSFDREPRVSIATLDVLHDLVLRSEPAQVPLREACELGEVCVDENLQENVSMLESKPEGGTDEKRGYKAETISQEQSLMIEDVFECIDLQDTSAVVGVQSNDFFDEFELMINESEDFVPESCMNLFEALDVNDYDENGIAKQPFDFVSNVAEKPGLQVDTIESDTKVFEIIGCKEEEAPKLVESEEVISSGALKTSSLTLQRDVEVEKPVNSTQVLLDSVSRIVEDDDVEEGEISGDDMLVEDDDDSLVERHEKTNISLDVVDKRGEGVGNSHHIGLYSIGSSSFCGVGTASIVDNQAKETEQTSYNEEKMDLGTSIKKRSARSKAAKDRKRANFRKKRAQERIALGVKKLKLKTVAPKPKPIKYCRHYRKGRCHEGEKCKFSHDFTPETKSLPCCHFATQSCMKGDDCPYDHDLSKYPCKNFIANGFCYRGDNCLFSHKVNTINPNSLGTPQSSSDAPSMNVTAASSTNIVAASQNSNKQTVREAIAKIPGIQARVSSSVAFFKPPSQHNQRNSSDASPSKISERPQIPPPFKKPSVAPKGISFLSLDRISQEKDTAKLSPASKQNTHNTDNQSLNQSQQRNFLPQAAPKETSSMLVATEEHKALNQEPREPESSINLKTRRFQSHIQSSLNSAMKLAAEFETAKVERHTNHPVEEAGNKGDVKVTRNSGNISSKILEFLSSFSDLKT
ncbi:unnamed protein product [Cochlearia groenlandica]